jgi:hypothetical protein
MLSYYVRIYFGYPREKGVLDEGVHFIQNTFLAKRTGSQDSGYAGLKKKLNS